MEQPESARNQGFYPPRAVYSTDGRAKSREQGSSGVQPRGQTGSRWESHAVRASDHELARSRHAKITMATGTQVVEVFDTILTLVYLPALILIFFVVLYYASPILGKLYMSGGSNRLEAIISLVFVLLWLAIMLVTLLL
jgi:hypothetical protein